MTKMRLIPLLALLFSLTLGVLADGAQAQTKVAGAPEGNPFAPVIVVNDLGISGYEIGQRMRFMQLLRQGGDLRAAAEKALIEDRLRMWQARQDGIALKPEAVQQGMAEFAARANMTVEQFVSELAKAGVDAPTYRDFVTAGMVWREEVRARFAPRVQITEADIDRALALEASRGAGTRVLISEIIIPAPPGEEEAAMAKAQRASGAQGEGNFGALARELSASASAAQGGRLDWMALENLPPALRSVVLGLKPGQATAPLTLDGAMAVFMLRAIDDGGPVAQSAQTLGYAALTLGAPGSEEAAALAAKAAANAKRCDDLYTVAKGLPESRLERVDGAAQSALPQDIAVALAPLDVGESAQIRRGGNDVLVMLCAREKLLDETKGETAPSRTDMRERLLNQRLEAYSESFLADLMAAAVIVRK